MGGTDSSSYPTGLAEIYNPDTATCQLPLSTIPGDGLRRPIVFNDANNVYACGLMSNFINCFKLGATWTNVLTSTNFHFINDIIAFKFGKQIFFIDDKNPEVILDITKNPFTTDFATAALNVPKSFTNLTNGGGCTLVSGDYVYVFGGVSSKSIRRIFLKAPVASWKWEYLADLPSKTPDCSAASDPANRNLIFVTTSTGGILIYDIWQNTLTPASTPVNLSGASLVELCRSGNLFAVTTNQGVKSNLATAGGLNSAWTSVTTAINLPYYSTTFVVPKAAITALGGSVGACAGC